MRLQPKQVTKTIGLKPGEGTKFTLGDDKLAMVVHLLSQHVDIISTIVREISSNAIDSHKEAIDLGSLTYEEVIKDYAYYKSLPKDETLALMKSCSERTIGNIKISINNGEMFNDDPTITIEDHGVGISPDRFLKIYSSYFSSTKNETDNQIGAFGLGGKTPLGYARLFTLTTRYNGLEYKYLVHKGDEVPIGILQSTEETDEPNGTIIEVAIKEGDIGEFKNACVTQLAYFTGVEFFNTDIDPDVEVLMGEHFAVRSDSVGDGYSRSRQGTTRNWNNKLHLCIGHVHYPLDYNLVPLNISTKRWDLLNFGYPQYPEHMAFALRFSPDEFKDLDLMWNRESVEYTPKTKESIAKKLTAAINELQVIADKATNDFTNPFTYYRALKNQNQAGGALVLTDNCSIHGVSENISQPGITYKGQDLEIRSTRILALSVLGVRAKFRKEGRVKLRSNETLDQIINTLDHLTDIFEGDDPGIQYVILNKENTITKGKAEGVISKIYKEFAICIHPTTYADSLAQNHNNHRWQNNTISKEAEAGRNAFSYDMFELCKTLKSVIQLDDIEVIKSTRGDNTLAQEIKTGIMCSREAVLGPSRGDSSFLTAKERWVSKVGSDSDYWNQHNEFRIAIHDKFVNSGRLLIYGGMDDNDKLHFANRMITASGINTKNFLVIKISEENQRHMEYMGAVYVDDFILMRVPASRIITRTLSAYYLLMAMEGSIGLDYATVSSWTNSEGPVGTLSESVVSFLSKIRCVRVPSRLLVDHFSFYEDYEKRRKKEIKILGKTEMRPVFDLTYLAKAKDLKLLLEQFPLLKSLKKPETEDLNDYLCLKESRPWILRAHKKKQTCLN